MVKLSVQLDEITKPIVVEFRSVADAAVFTENTLAHFPDATIKQEA